MQNKVWTEKFRPKTLDDVIGQEHAVKFLKAFVKQGNIPNMLFAGQPGTGKTASAIALCRDFYGKKWRDYYFEVNASDESRVEFMRTKIKEIAGIPLFDQGFKVIFMDEADYLCLGENTNIITGWNTNQQITNIKDISTNRYISMPSLNLKTKKIEKDMGKRINPNKKELFSVELEDGRKIECSKDHKFFVKKNNKLKEKKLSELKEGEEIIDCFDDLNINRCEVCGRITVRKRFCSYRCANKGHSIDISGKNNPWYGKSWNKGKTKEDDIRIAKQACYDKKNGNYGGTWHGERFWDIATDKEKQEFKKKLSLRLKGKTFKELFGENELIERAKRISRKQEDYSKNIIKIATEIWIEDKLENKKYVNCELCNKKLKIGGHGKNNLIIHHKDGNHNNHIPENLMFVCPKCHNFKCHNVKENFLEKGWKITHRKKVLE